MSKKPSIIGIVGAGMGKTTAPNVAFVEDNGLLRKSIEELAASVSGNGISVEVCRPPTNADLSGLKALFDAVEPTGDVDDIGPA